MFLMGPKLLLGDINPLSTYGQSKLLGEQLFLTQVPDCLSIGYTQIMDKIFTLQCES